MNLNNVVLDASAILAVLHAEKGSDKLPPELLAHASVSTVNIAEVQSRLVARGWNADEAWEDCTDIVDEVVPFSSEQAKNAGTLVSVMRSFGLSLGDRACLALAIEKSAAVYTADRSWKNLKLSIPIHVIR